MPDASVAYAHGQMSERELEKIMYQFINGEIDVLVSTTIIETGLDISNVNTMIIHDSLPDQFIIIFHHISLNRLTIHRCFLQQTHIPNTDQTHMHRSRNRSGRQCQYIHILFDFFDLLLVGNTKSLLLIYHQQTKVLKLYIFRQKTMCDGI